MLGLVGSNVEGRVTSNKYHDRINSRFACGVAWRVPVFRGLRTYIDRVIASSSGPANLRERAQVTCKR